MHKPAHLHVEGDGMRGAKNKCISVEVPTPSSWAWAAGCICEELLEVKEELRGTLLIEAVNENVDVRTALAFRGEFWVEGL